MEKLIECVPNFSEGLDLEKIHKITNEIESVKGIRLLNVDPGKATNRTVITFIGNPEAVIEAAFLAIKKAGEILDMRFHEGAHPRMGATDVCPLIPIANISMDETVNYAKLLAEKVGRDLEIPVYLYEEAQQNKQRSNLSHIRAGEYEGFSEKIKLTEWKPDYGPSIFDLKRGATVIGARDFLIAYNINLNTQSVQRANSVAFDVRETGRILRENDSPSGKEILDEAGKPIWKPGSLKSVKAIGWFIKEYGIAQISMNLTNIRVTPLHFAFDEVCKKAVERGLRVTGSEIVGLIPLQCLLETAKYFLSKQNRSAGLSEDELINFAIITLGLNQFQPFKPEERIIEYLLDAPINNKLIGLSLKEFANEIASESPAPGGGSVSAYLGVLAISLGTMVANLSAHKRSNEDRLSEFSHWAEIGQKLKKQILALVDEDTKAFLGFMEAFGMPKNSEIEKNIRKTQIQVATQKAIEIPFQVMKSALESFDLLSQMAESGNPNSISDIGVGALCARTAIQGAYLNVKINGKNFKDKTWIDPVLVEAEKIEKLALEMEKQILDQVNFIINTL